MTKYSWHLIVTNLKWRLTHAGGIMKQSSICISEANCRLVPISYREYEHECTSVIAMEFNSGSDQITGE